MKHAILFLIAAVAMFCVTPAWAGEIEMGGLIEVAVGSLEEDGTKSEDIAVPTVELDLAAQPDEGVDVEVVLLYEEDDTPLDVDTATITYALSDSAYFLGGMTVPPFGNYATSMISDPLTLVVGETGQSIAAIGFGSGPVGVEVGAFNGDVITASDTDEKISVYYAAVSYENESGISAGASWISSIADSDSLEGEITNSIDPNANNIIDSLVAGYSAYVTAEFGQFSLGVEYITAAGSFKAGEMGYAVDENAVAQESKPQAMTIEVAYSASDRLSMAARYETSKDLYSLAPEKQSGIAVSYALKDNTTLAAEYISGTYAKNGAGVEDVKGTTVKLAVEF